jgi:hypothetical protein
VIGYLYSYNGPERVWKAVETIILCCGCNGGYRADYHEYIFSNDLRSTDQWAQRQLCAHCGLRLIEAAKLEEEEALPQRSKPGPKPKYGERWSLLLNVPLDIKAALDRVAIPDPGYTEFILECIKRHPSIAEALKDMSRIGDTQP